MSFLQIYLTGAIIWGIMIGLLYTIADKDKVEAETGTRPRPIFGGVLAGVLWPLHFPYIIIGLVRSITSSDSKG